MCFYWAFPQCKFHVLMTNYKMNAESSPVPIRRSTSAFSSSVRRYQSKPTLPLNFAVRFLFLQCCRSASERIFELKRKVFQSFALISYCWERKKLFSPLQSLCCRCNVKEVVWIFWYKLGGAAEIKSQCVFNCWLQFHLFCECMASELLSRSRFSQSIECVH